MVKKRAPKELPLTTEELKLQVKGLQGHINHLHKEMVAQGAAFDLSVREIEEEYRKRNPDWHLFEDLEYEVRAAESAMWEAFAASTRASKRCRDVRLTCSRILRSLKKPGKQAGMSGFVKQSERAVKKALRKVSLLRPKVRFLDGR